MILRPYQETAVASVTTMIDHGTKKMIGVAATGAGKTVITSEIARRVGGRVLFLCHRNELLYQPIDGIVRSFPELRPYGVVGRGYDKRMWGSREKTPYAANYVTCTIQTAERRPSLLEDITKHGDLSLVIVDEAHRYAEAYQRLIERVVTETDAAVLGVTATPLRSDGFRMGEIYDEVAFNISFSFLVNKGYLARPEGMVFGLGADISGVDVGDDGDYIAEQLDTVLSAANANEVIFEKWVENAANKQTIVFCAGVKQARELHNLFAEAGHETAVITGATPLKERIGEGGILPRFKDKRIKVLINVNVLIEGADVPTVECVVMGRCTKSIALYQQCVGRGSRLCEGKTSFLVLDFAPQGAKGLVGVEDILGQEDEETAVSDEEVLGREQCTRDCPEEGADVVAENVGFAWFNLLTLGYGEGGILGKRVIAGR
ncbi:MAG: DEAD/DEAH box helicase [Hyphomicrobiaceae bacterium]|nr:MAG: DEAD/DEAH box helicase [Hyphomicrobiaceae bacterium]